MVSSLSPTEHVTQQEPDRAIAAGGNNAGIPAEKQNELARSQ
jgi:hypothetical protein